MVDGTMSISCHTLNYPALYLGKTFKYGTNRCGRVIPALATPSPSTLVNLNETENSQRSGRGSGPNMSMPNKDSDCGFVLSQANAIGVIGGASVGTTLSFLRKLAVWGPRDGIDCPPFLLCSDPQLEEELLVYERSSFPSLYSQTRPAQFDHKAVVENLRRKRVFLERGGAHCLVMPCHLLHSWYDDITKGCHVPILHMAECVATELKEAQLKPLGAGSPLRIGLVATDAILAAGFYQEKLQNEGFEVVLPDKATMEHTVRPAIEALDRNDIEGARNLLRIALQVLLVRAVNMVVIASHDMRELLPDDDPLLKKCIDPIDSLVRSTIRWASMKNVCEIHLDIAQM